ncbi:4-hydroxy-tetrahydrodipicolinate synthase [Gallaecimonas pentaromativorans]|uniref:4-hydroxy-tetrahydrodipicolinate synthase n=1 Tax=Gallaecimonas pentaromativorans TaxID=584787 RepID=UPI00067EBB6E|nr:4-hydroxy-tetrahydrodipicolinate synthase [Gallaecimonas pentaromativorans]MED5524180.1 4-hydroxy-tetrahydrodipicolinate synthase [Pseudomonadota bacterium]
MFSGSIVALVTPMTVDGAVDFDALKALVQWHIEQGTQGICAVGTTGESATLETDEHIAVVKTVCDLAQGRLKVIAGNGGSATHKVVALTKALDALPIDGFLTATPAYNKPTQQGLIAHFKAVAAATDKPVVLYNVPGRTAVDMKPQTVAVLSELPNIVAIKEATGDLARLADLQAQVAPGFALLSGDDATCRAFMLAGGHGIISVTANVAPKAMRQMCDKALAGDGQGALAIDSLVQGLHRSLFVEANPTPAKWALKRLGLLATDTLRLPLVPLTEAGQASVEADLKNAGLI